MAEQESMPPESATKAAELCAPRAAVSPIHWLFLSGILAAYTVGITLLGPSNFFGMMEDDSLYLSSARAIAQGHGYVMASVPGTPPGTKYPILYPWLLSWVWRLNPEFPGNLSWAVGLNVLFGMIFLVACFLLLRKLSGLGETPALIITAFCAFQPVF